MGKGYKKYLALALSIALILESQVMSVSAASSSFDSDDNTIETLTMDGENSQEAEPAVEPVFEENAEGEADGQDDEGLFTGAGSNQNPDEGSGNLIDDDEKLREYDLEEVDEDGLGENLDKDNEEGLEDDLEYDLEEELGEDLEENLEEITDGEAKPMLGASTLAEASAHFQIEDGVLVKYNGSAANVVIPDGVVEIADSVFESKDIKSVTLPESVKVIGRYAFKYCEKLEDINLENVEIIGNFAFLKCGISGDVDLGKVVEIGDSAFGLCQNLERISLENVEIIGDYAFAYCSNLEGEGINLENVEKIGDRAFEYVDFSKITIPKGTVCGDYVFCGATIRQLCFEDGREEIPEIMLALATVQHIYIPGSVTSIGYIPEGALIHGERGSFAKQYANYNSFRFFNNKLSPRAKTYKSVIDGDSPSGEFIWETDNGAIATVDKKGYVYCVSEGTCNILAKDVYGTEIGRCTVTVTNASFEIEDGVLVRYFGKEEDVVIPDGVVEIGIVAFINRRLKSVRLSDSVRIIHSAVFENQEALEYVNLEKVVEIGFNAFKNCKSIKTITIPNGVVCGRSAFQGANIRQLYFEDGTTTIPQIMLENATIEHIYIPNSVTSIGKIPEGTIIHGESGSYIQKYANHEKFRFFNRELSVGIYSSASVITGDSSDVKCIWESDNESIATVDENGVVTGISGGTCTVYAKNDDGTIIDSCTVTVDKPYFEINDGVLVKYIGIKDDVVIPDGVVEIGPEVFRNSDIKSVKLPESVKVIGKAAFSDSGLEHINLENVEIIGDYAFYFSGGLESVDLESVKKIGEYAFTFCIEIEDVKLPKAVELGTYAFSWCKSIKSIELSDNLEILGFGAFGDCSNISKVTIPKGTVCGKRVFYDTNVGQLYFEDGAKEIPQDMLEGATIKHIYVPESVTSIAYIPEDTIIHGETESSAKQYATDNNRRFFNNKLSVKAGSTINVIDGDASEGEFIWESDDESIATVDGKGTISGVVPGSCNIYAKDSDGVVLGCCAVTVKDANFEIEDGVLVKYIGNDRDVVIPDGVVKIGDEAFYNKNIKSVKLPESVKVIGKNAFKRCYYLKNINLENVETIEYEGFRECGISGDVDLGNVVEIGENAFAFSPNLERISLENVEKIGGYAFYECKKLKDVKLGGNAEIGSYAFYKCTELEHINLENVEKIGEWAFRYCFKLEDVDLGKAVEIGGYAFADCTSFKNIELPDSLEKLGEGAFCACENISRITIPKGTVCKTYVFGRAKVRQLYFEDGTNEISQRLLKDATIEHIYIPKSVTSIGYIPEGALIHGESESTAQQYANDNSFRFFNTRLTLEEGSTITVIDGGTSEGEFALESDNEAIATVDTMGVVTGVSEGNCRVTAKTADDTEIGSCVINVTKKARIVPVDELTISQISAQEYIGGEIQPKLEVKDGETVLEEGKHYTLTYSSNKAVGTGYVTITGAPENGYEGSKKISFKIKAFDIAKNEGERFVISYEDTVEYSVTGTKPKVSISFNNADGTTKKLKAGTDYTVSYKNNKNYSSQLKPTIVITAKGSYTGKKELQFKLKERDISKANMVATDMLWLGWPDTYCTITVITDSGYILLPGIDYESLKYVYANKTVVKVNGKKVTRNAGDTIGKNDVIPADTTLKVIATAKKGSGYTGTVSATYKLYSIGSIIRSIFG